MPPKNNPVPVTTTPPKPKATAPTPAVKKTTPTAGRPTAGPSAPRPGATGGPPPPPPPPPGPAGSIGIGIETEFFLREKRPLSADGRAFAIKFCTDYMNFKKSLTVNPAKGEPEIPGVYTKWPGVIKHLEPPSGHGKHADWVTHQDPTVDVDKDLSPAELKNEEARLKGAYGIEVISHILRAYEGSARRREVEKMWEFIDANYTVLANRNCSTHVHLSRAEPWNVIQIKRLAQAIVHFEPAFEAMVPPERRNNEYARSNWIDNARFVGKSRDQAMDMIEQQGTIKNVIHLMHGADEQSKYYGWNFLTLESYKTVEFRRGAPSMSVKDVFMWVELAMEFMQAAIIVKTRADFSKYARNVGGLKKLIADAGLKQTVGTNQKAYLEPLYRRAGADTAMLEPKPVKLETLSKEKKAKLKMKIEADKKWQPMLDMLRDAQAHQAL
ncbi:putative amidoligase enzyme-domain-containing protein [Triangularia verruculosa]|uniref:Amidoligase enzyme-domain-containing protein n=1 Tax=Triangularia verruculosa TaxID=2587418 RepID=A0AAN6XM88_9PEZI|nr:putative amidoligase enzyme-domain-containing protein [Triangularia verruculosa]